MLGDAAILERITGWHCPNQIRCEILIIVITNL